MDYVMLGKPFDQKIFEQDRSKWLISEKMDGQRCLYIRDHGVFYSRLRSKIHVPQWWKDAVDAALVDVESDVIDGELWCGRGKFQQTQSIVRRTVNLLDAEWKKVKFVPFDLVPRQCMVGLWGSEYFPNNGRTAGYKDWIDRLRLIRDNRICQSIKCYVPNNLLGFTDDEINGLLQVITTNGGEGLMFRDKTVTWNPKRGTHLMKMKPMITGTGYITAIERGKERGAIMVRSAEHKEFKVGTGFTNDEFRNLQIGLWINFAYRELTDAGVPKEARFLGIFRGE